MLASPTLQDRSFPSTRAAISVSPRRSTVHRLGRKRTQRTSRTSPFDKPDANQSPPSPHVLSAWPLQSSRPCIQRAPHFAPARFLLSSPTRSALSDNRGTRAHLPPPVCARLPHFAAHDR